MKVKHIDNRKENFQSGGLIVKASGASGLKWFDNEVTSDTETRLTSLNSTDVSNMKSEAETLYYKDIASYRKISGKKKDFAWIHTVLQSGTLCDKISAQVLLIQDSPVHNYDNIEKMVGMVSTKDKRACLMAMDTLRDLYMSDLLPPKRKLKTFEQHTLEELGQPTGKNSALRNKKLVLWYFEDKLKFIYTDFVKRLKDVGRDIVEKTKQKAVSIMAELLKSNPEQERFLLEHLVNKIGDPSQKVGAHTCHLLGQVLVAHPLMKGVVSQEVERLLFRPNICDRTKYYCLCVLNQIILSHGDKNIANHLIKIYFGLFKACVKKGEVNNKIMSALLRGVYRAHPYAALEEAEATLQLNAMYKMVHLVSFNISIQALQLIFQVLDSKDSVSERFYSALYRKLLDPAIATSSRHSMLLNLIHRALKKDVSSERVKAFVKRLIQISLYQAPQLQCGIMYVISDLAKIHPNLMKVVNTAAFDSDSDEDEHYEDVVEEDDENVSGAVLEKASKSKVYDGTSNTASWVHKQNQNCVAKKSDYDPHCRNPLYAGAEYCNMWELRFLRNSYHPSVSLFAHQISGNQEIKYSGDPLQDFTLTRFLDRFVYRNPKKTNQDKIQTPDFHRKVFGSRKLYVPSGSRQLSVTSDEYLQQDESNVPAEENFIFRFLQKHARSEKKKKGRDFDIESVNSEEFEEILDKYKTDVDKDSLDFVKELSGQKQKKSKKSKADVDDDNDDDFGSLQSGSDLEDPDFDSDEDFEGAFEEFDDDLKEADETKTAFECEDFEEDFDQPRSSKSLKKKKRFEEENLFASADQFDSLLEEGSKIDSTTSHAFINKDKSDAKQIIWEQKRDQYVRGVNWKSKKGQKFRKGPRRFQRKFQKTGKKLKKNKK